MASMVLPAKAPCQNNVFNKLLHDFCIKDRLATTILFYWPLPVDTG